MVVQIYKGIALGGQEDGQTMEGSGPLCFVRQRQPTPTPTPTVYSTPHATEPIEDTVIDNLLYVRVAISLMAPGGDMVSYVRWVEDGCEKLFEEIARDCHLRAKQDGVTDVHACAQLLDAAYRTALSERAGAP